MILPGHRQFLGVALKGKAYKYLVLLSDLSLAPYTFIKCPEAVLAPLWETGICILAYLDDWALLASSRECGTVQLSLTLARIQALGFSVNLKKSSMILSQQLSFHGLEICSILGQAQNVLRQQGSGVSTVSLNLI